MVAAARGISLRRLEQSRVFVPNRGEAFRLVIVAEDAVQMSEEVFAHQKRLVDPYTGETGDEFVFVCSPFDLTIYPASEPDPTQFPPFFRKAQIDLLLPSTEAAETAWTVIYGEVCELVAAMNRNDRLAEGETIRCGAAVAESGGSPEESISLSL